MAKKYGLSKSWDYGHIDALNGLPKMSSARSYSDGYRYGRELFKRHGGRAGLLAFQSTKKTIGYASASQERRRAIEASYS